ncbi:protein pxr1-like [Willisornis vidua]|uniref:Protein pxr1-like n=1 Tax=Willisornis vidua TaxID=1566151 RepID=A0ABQ9DJ16_9PASS|nr:protein pxr1-like [Willisornis vidua]
MVKTMVRQAAPLQCMEVHGETDIHLQAMKDPMLKRECTKETVPRGNPMLQQAHGRNHRLLERATHAGVGLLAGLVIPQGNHTGEVCFLKDCIPWKGSMLEQLVKNCSLCK